mmetsp:Transcript_34298/g.82930  ORF Transcript_34298/g.82930 Transcript_34298/m.82930 type:complete len:1002 (-) Transcript_34298:240-3245(-)
MDQQGDDFPGGSPSGRHNNNNNNNVTGSTGLPNMFSPGMRGMDPEYAAAIDFEELRIRHQLEVQQDMELRRRLMEEQQHQLLSELEYRNKIQQLQELQELQAQQQHHQHQQQGLSQLLAQNPHLLELHQQQQYQSGRDNSLLASLRDDILLQRHQQMLQDHQMQQQLRDQLSRDSQQHEQEELMAMLQSSGNLKGVLPPNVASLRQEETITRQPSNEQSPDPAKPPPNESTPVPEEQPLNNSEAHRENSTSTNRDPAIAQADDSSTKRRSLSESMKMNGKGAPQDPPTTFPKPVESVTESPQVKPASSTNSSLNAMPEEKVIDNKSANDQELENRVTKLLESQKLGHVKEKATTEKKSRKKKIRKEELPAKKGGKRKRASATSQEGKKASKKDICAGDISKMSDHEQSVIDFLGSRGTKNGTLKKKKMNGKDTARGKKRGGGMKGATERDDKEAASIVLDFMCFKVPPGEVLQVKKWSKEKQTCTTAHPAIPLGDITSISPGLKFNIPSLPVEPEPTDSELAKMRPLLASQQADVYATDASQKVSSCTGSSSAVGERDNSGDVRYVRFQKKIFKPKKVGKGQDDWWPSNACIRKERRKRGCRQDEEDSDEESDADGEIESAVSFVKAGIEATKERLATSVEPGVLEKLPHCKLYDDFCKEKKKGNFAPKFCCQTTETFPFEPMVCCSVCSTWRHAQCGGNYKRYTAESVDPSNILFKPICDQCYLETKIIEDNPVAETRIERQRIEHLRRCNATNAVMRQVAFGKHSGQYKWPLGSVSTSHISGHTRSVQARHEKAEKQWSEMAARLGDGAELKPRDRQRIRTREFERLLVSIEDAEGVMDRHNMMLFLQNDTSKLHPAGFELPRRNVFDPDEDHLSASVHEEPAVPVKSLSNGNFNKNQGSKVDPVASMTNIKEQNQESVSGMEEPAAASVDEGGLGSDTDKEGASVVEECRACARQGCNQRPRFDSIFCSDSCGVSTLETDLLRTLHYASYLHPSVLRP